MIRAITLALSAALLCAGPTARAQKAPAHESPHKHLERSCEVCHTATSFNDIRFDHRDTGFQLDGRHAAVSCLSCHNVEDFSRVEAWCATCHQDVHHDRMGPDCAQCHTSRGWTVFDSEEIHARSDFPLLGRHTLLDCVACHEGSPTADFRRVWTQCVDCHRAEYIANPSIDHVAFGFSARCQDCHEMTGWIPSFMPDHDPLFPIYSGRHKNTWDKCTICHVDPGNRRVFECINCHEHNQIDMDDHHAGIPGYAYVSRDCYACHPTGEAGDFGAHDLAYFPIYSGSHSSAWATCASCHNNPAARTLYTCIDCHDHDPAPTDGAHQGIPGYAYTSTECFACHPDGLAGEFRDHDGLYFPIFSGKHRNEWNSCTICHDVPADRKMFTCISCHEHDQGTMDDKHLGEVQDYRYASDACYECHPDGTKEGNQ